MAIESSSGYSSWKGENKDYMPRLRVYFEQEYDDTSNKSSVLLKIQSMSGGTNGYGSDVLWTFVGYGGNTATDSNRYISVAINSEAAVKPVHGSTGSVYATLQTSKRMLKKTASKTGTDWSYSCEVPHDSSGNATLQVKIYGTFRYYDNSASKEYRKNVNMTFDLALEGQMQGRIRICSESGYQMGTAYICTDAGYQQGVVYQCGSDGIFRPGI